jgi:hypothetical protein
MLCCEMSLVVICAKVALPAHDCSRLFPGPFLLRMRIFAALKYAKLTANGDHSFCIWITLHDLEAKIYDVIFIEGRMMVYWRHSASMNEE